MNSFVLNFISNNFSSAMAHEMSRKINRIFNVYKLRYCSNSAKPKPLPTNSLESKNPALKEHKNEINESPENEKQDQPLITSNLEKNDIQLRRRFAKSSTQIALTQPLKLPRLANPFPEPVKTLQSDTVADDEKARLMHEQVKMEARYHLQMQQEKLLQQKLNKMSQEQNAQQQNDNMHQNETMFQNDTYNQQPQSPFEQFQNTPPKTIKNKQPNYRKPKSYNEQEYEQNGTKCQTQDTNNDQKTESCEANINMDSESQIKTESESKKNESRSKRGSRSRQARHVCYSRHSRRQAHRQYYTTSYRRYSTKSPILNPDIIPESEQADYILERLKTLYPEYKNLTKPVFISGSEEEREFIQHILKLLGKHKQEAQTIKKTCAPFPSYSEIKTYVHDQKQMKNNVFDTNIRHYHTEKQNSSTPISLTNSVKKPKRCQYVPYSPNKKHLRKKEAPYPSYSEVNDEYDESTFLNQWRPDTTFNSKKKYYSTTVNSKYSEKQARKKKPPCKNPFPPLPECDYEETARKRDEKNKRERRCPNKKKSASNVENSKVIGKIKTWLKSYKLDADKIKIMRSPVNVEGRETYVIEVDETNEVTEKELSELEDNNAKPAEKVEVEMKSAPKAKVMPFQKVDYKLNECSPSHVVELSDNIPVTTKNIPGFNSSHEPDANPVVVKKAEILTLKKAEILTLKKPDTKTVEVEEPKYLVPVSLKPTEIKKIENTDKIKHLLSRKPDYPKINVVKDHLQVKSSKTEFRTKPIIIEDNIECKLMNHNSLQENKMVRFKAPKPSNKPVLPNYTLANFEYNFNKRLDNKCREDKFERNFPVPCPSQALLAPKSDDKCKKIEKKPACEKKKKCRYKKKRKLPSCDDVAGKKSKGCVPFYISELDSKNLTAQKYMSINSKSAFGNLKAEDVDMLANQSLQKGNTKPFKLKPEFWRK